VGVVGIDTGGTFCDLVHVGADGRAHGYKSPSTPKDPAQGVFDVLDVTANAVRAPADEFLSRIHALALGTTIAVNTVVTHSGAKVGLLTTAGHADMLSIMRVNGRVAGCPPEQVQNYAATDKPAPLVPKPFIAEINERIDYTGDILIPQSDEEVGREIERLVRMGIESLAVSYLWSFLNPAHEIRVREIARVAHPNLFVSLGHELAQRLGEYERTEAAVVNAYVALSVRRYLERVHAGLKKKQFAAPLFVMHSAGGVGTEQHSLGKPITTLFSGPAGGIVASMQVARAAGFDNVICADVGGTTFDVGLVVKGRPVLRSTSTIDQRVMFCPTIDIVSIGAGGGSIARVSPENGRLTVGPESAGAQPGPACYGQGGVMPTVTDAVLVLGYMHPDRFLGGRLTLDLDAAKRAIHQHVADPLNIDVMRAAAGIFAIVNAKMADLVRKVTVERGFDPRDFALCAYGGLGPLHAPFFAGDLSVKAVMVPLGELSSVFSAYGIATADILHVREVSRNLREPFGPEIEATFKDLVHEADEQLDRDGVAPANRSMRRFVDVRYVGQLNEMVVELPEKSVASFDIRNAFERQYLDAFGPGAAWEKAAIEINGLRLEIIGRRPRIKPTQLRLISGHPMPASRREVYWPQISTFSDTAIFDGDGVGPSQEVRGPAIIEFATTTIAVPPRWSCQPDDIGNLMLRSHES
jgi:N-methylhydantoinase A